MAKRTTYDCDICKKPASPRFENRVDIGRYTDGAGSRESDTVLFDLCSACAQIALRQFFHEMTETEARGWVKQRLPSARDYQGRPL
jgi:hypothetical protein